MSEKLLLVFYFLEKCPAPHAVRFFLFLLPLSLLSYSAHFHRHPLPFPAKKTNRKKNTTKIVSYCDTSTGCSGGFAKNSCVLKHVDDVYNPRTSARAK